MSTALAQNFKGFTVFLIRAKNEIFSWYGSYCNHDVAKIAFMASKEWDGMTFLEKRPFLTTDDCKDDQKNQNLEKKEINPKHDQDYGENVSILSDERCPPLMKDLHLMDKDRRNKLNSQDTAIDYVLEQRNKLHELYRPRDLNILEFIIKTKPRWPLSSRLWFLRSESKYIQSAVTMKKWHNLTNEERNLYERCAVLDAKRYSLEKNAWVTKIIGVDLDNDNFTLTDFEISHIRSQIESMGSILELSRDLPQNIGLKRPREPFSIFIEAYQYQIRETRPKFQFGRHLRDCSKAWNELSQEEKQFYRDESAKLKEKRKLLLADDLRASESRLSVPVDLFIPNKAVFGPCRPSHLYPKLPSLVSFWASKENVATKPLKSQWDSLDVEEKKSIQSEYRKLKESIHEEKKRIDRKHSHVKKLLGDAKKLLSLKRELKLVGQSRQRGPA